MRTLIRQRRDTKEASETLAITTGYLGGYDNNHSYNNNNKKKKKER
jgi:hypothetical protein